MLQHISNMAPYTDTTINCV